MTHEKKATIIDSLTRGSITINRVEEYTRLLLEYPDSGDLNRLFADFLQQNHSFADAIEKYRQAYTLFMEEGETLRAIAALLALWDVVKATPHDIRLLYSQLQRKDSHLSVIGECFAKMSYPEIRAVLPCVERVRATADEIVQHSGEPEEALYFVVSGELVKTPSKTEIGAGYAVIQFLKANDHFGDDFPFEVKRPVSYTVKASCEAELLKIAKMDFLSLIKKFPDLKGVINKLVRYRMLPDEKKPEKFFRKTSRRHLAIYLSLDILDPEVGRHPLCVKGFSSDISLGGACVIVDPRYRDLPVDDIVNRKTVLRISLPDESISVSIIGKVAWCKKTEIDDEITYALGVQFNEMPPSLRGSMIIFVNAVGTTSQHISEYTFSQDEIEAR